MSMTKEEADARVAAAHALHDRMEAGPRDLEEFDEICQEYERTCGFPMVVRLAVLDEVTERTPPEVLERLWRKRQEEAKR